MSDEKKNMPNHCRPVIISGAALMIYLVGVIVACGLAFGAGWKWREREHLIEVQEVTEIQDGMREDIGELQSWRVEFDNRLEALQACANAAGWGRIQSKVQNPKLKIEY
ncbi:MAG: hypothetical protein M0R06_14605 [Sphaerochaeta sp.]|jgi:hypothetical protein|nr:hypothetical protein [Sphaerochaeta sp.]